MAELGSADIGASSGAAYDARSLNSLKVASKNESPEALKAVAKQFEAIFMNMMLKSMREATPKDSPFENEQSRTFTSMLDQQLTQNFSEKGIGLSDILIKQLSKNIQTSQLPSVYEKPTIKGANGSGDIAKTIVSSVSGFKRAIEGYADKATEVLHGTANNFQNKMIAHAEAASKISGVPANFMLGQAALESGWGKREIKTALGENSHNLFGIKATGGWKGKVTETMTTEYVNGVAQKRVEKFRAYDSYTDSFKDFAALMQNNPRYKKVMANLHSITGYANAMQQAGYATDPNYAAKLASIIKKVENS